MQHNIIGGRCSTFSDGQVAIGCNILTLLTATTYDVLQEGVLRGHEAPPSSRHHYLDSVNFRNVDGSTGPNQKRATIVPFVIFKRKRNLKGERERVGGGRRRAGKRRKEVFFFQGKICDLREQHCRVSALHHLGGGQEFGLPGSKSRAAHYDVPTRRNENRRHS